MDFLTVNAVWCFQGSNIENSPSLSSSPSSSSSSSSSGAGGGGEARAPELAQASLNNPRLTQKGLRQEQQQQKPQGPLTTLGEDEEVKDFSRWEIKRSTLMKCVPTTISFYSHRNDEVDHLSTLSRHSSSSATKGDRRGGRGHPRMGGRNNSSSSATAAAAAAAAAARASTYCPVTACASEASTARGSAFSAASASAANEEGARRVDPTAALETNRGQEWAEIQRLASINGRSELPPLRTQHHAR